MGRNNEASTVVSAEEAARVHLNFSDPAKLVTTSFEYSSTPAEYKETRDAVAAILEHGYAIIPDVLSPEKISEMKAALAPHLAQHGRNAFEGESTQRAYALLNKSRAFDELLLSPRVLRILDALLIDNHLLSAFQAIKIHPGETPQPFHYDDQFVPFPRPREYTSVATIWAIDEFTSTNGATNVIPGSHAWGNRQPREEEAVPVVMTAGSVVIFLSTLWHRGGRNTSGSPRLAITSQHCQPYMRPQENQLLAVDNAVTTRLHPRLQRMMGLSIHPPFIGHANGEHPAKALASKL